MKNKLLLLFMSVSMLGTAQNNSLKCTVSPGLVIANNLAFNYERKFGDRLSLNTRLNFTSKNSVPFNKLAKDQLGPILDSNDINSSILDTRVNSFGMNFQFKFYPGGDALRGFYLTPYVGFQIGNMQDFEFDFPDQTDPSIKHGGTVEAGFAFIGAGIGFGNQFVMNNGLTFDILWLGLGLGANKISLRGTDTSGDVDYEEINNDVQQFKTDEQDNLDTYNASLESNYSANDINVFIRHPFPYLKILNFSIGYSF